MPTDLPTTADHAVVTSSNAVPAADGPTRAAQKGAATALRHKNERRADRLDQINAQIVDGTLIVRQMTAAEQKAASKAARGSLARSEARGEHNRALCHRNP